MAVLRCETDGAVATITLDRPQVRNALDRALLDALTEALREVNRDDAVRAVVVTGAGSVFCAGGDLKALFRDVEPVDVRRLVTQYLRPPVHAMLTLDKPVVCALNGPVAGAGLALPLASDFVIAADSARFVTAFGHIGAVPDAAVTWLLAHHLGLMRAKDVVLRARTLEPGEALALGLCTQVVPAGELGDATRALADELARGPTQALGFTRRALTDAIRLPFDAWMELEAAGQALMYAGRDLREGVTAFGEKRAPRFTGR